MILKVVLSICLGASVAFAETRDEKSCQEAYRKLYQKDEVKMSLFFGYLDHGAQTYDRAAVADFIEMAIAPCTETMTLCGFTRDPDDAEIFTKTIAGPGGAPKKVRLQIVGSSYSDSDEANLGKYANQQRKKSDEVTEKYMKALGTDEVVIYNGHARYGTGPGFKPLSKTDWMKAVINKPVLNDVLKTLKESKHQPQIIGMIACESEDYYGYHLHEASPQSALFITRQTTESRDSNLTAYYGLSSILGMRCHPEFKKNMDASTNYFFINPGDGGKSYKDKMPDIYGFFEPFTKTFEKPSAVSVRLLDVALPLQEVRPKMYLNNTSEQIGTQ